MVMNRASGCSTDGAARGESSLLELFRVVTEEDEVNAMEPGTILPIHRHSESTETVVVLRGKIKQNFYDEAGQLVESFIVSPCSDMMGFSVELGRWHNTECLESGTVILECKDGKYEALNKEDILDV